MTEGLRETITRQVHWNNNNILDEELNVEEFWKVINKAIVVEGKEILIK